MTRTAKSPATLDPSVTCLPFVRSTKLNPRTGRRRSFWDVGQIEEDNDAGFIGEEMAVMALAFMASDPSGFNILSSVAEDQAMTPCDLMKSGFWRCIYHYAMEGFRIHGEELIQEKREREALMIARYRAQQVHETISRARKTA